MIGLRLEVGGRIGPVLIPPTSTSTQRSNLLASASPSHLRSKAECNVFYLLHKAKKLGIALLTAYVFVQSVCTPELVVRNLNYFFILFLSFDLSLQEIASLPP